MSRHSPPAVGPGWYPQGSRRIGRPVNGRAASPSWSIVASPATLVHLLRPFWRSGAEARRDCFSALSISRHWAPQTPATHRTGVDQLSAHARAKARRAFPSGPSLQEW
ncbi:hypothetical protein KCH_48800 [Kitasatospora cheerisanensis KCTC 2395]|uniref:Uncharacterized protein n=1 Tax=Kitasatospora cheerisanensis KCTC 2395 TaxID=1348663 RepID=A0A066YPB9_9ACTN|nr:hypothetical protein KCH_48800 [Kitasatospora cheerisanensis KCTC 2395]